MATELKPFETKRTGKVYMTRFGGGKKDGLCVQVTPSGQEYGGTYFALTREEALQFARVLLDFAAGEEKSVWE